jgi:hypothetical protein
VSFLAAETGEEDTDVLLIPVSVFRFYILPVPRGVTAAGSMTAFSDVAGK